MGGGFGGDGWIAICDGGRGHDDDAVVVTHQHVSALCPIERVHLK